MRAGQLRHRLEIQAATETRDAAGAVVQTWVTQTTRWAAIEPLRGQELFSARMVDPKTTDRIRLRHYAPLTTSHRFKLGARVFNILERLNKDERNRELICLCSEDTD